MRYTAKLRILLILLAILPPLLIVLILNFSISRNLEVEQQKNIEQAVKKAESFILSEQGHIKYDLTEFVKDSVIVKYLTSQKKYIERNKARLTRSLQKYRFDYFYLTNDSGRVLYVYGKPGLEKEQINQIQDFQNQNLFTIESDQQGEHGALSYVTKVDSIHYVYAGKFVDHTMIYLLSNISDATVHIKIGNENLAESESDSVTTTLITSRVDNLSILLRFGPTSNKQLYNSVLQVISFVTVAIILLALIIGFYITGKTKKEIDNLRSAFAKVADGHFDTTVMAYEQSEFSELADSFSEMIVKLKSAQAKLSTVEKIAAWQTVGQKLAHEIKNPLSPISIAADDIRSSYFEKLPQLDKTIDESTSTIKKEVKRMTQLLDEFVSFARMKQSTLKEIELSVFVEELEKLFAHEIAEKKLIFTSDVTKAIVKLDTDTCTQLFLNIVKNGFESKENAIVEIKIMQNDFDIVILITDNGPGFSEEILTNSFTPFQTTKKHGSGLGLIICHRIVLDHNGTLTLQNKIDGGGQVIITIPFI